MSWVLTRLTLTKNIQQILQSEIVLWHGILYISLLSRLRAVATPRFLLGALLVLKAAFSQDVQEIVHGWQRKHRLYRSAASFYLDSWTAVLY